MYLFAKSTAVLFLFFFLALSGLEARSENSFAAEAGILTATNFVLSSMGKNNVTSGWKRKPIPTVRGEFWHRKATSWNFGAVLLPVYFRSSGNLKDDLVIKGTSFQKDASVKLDYQFHNFRVSANYPVLDNNEETSYLRIGASVISRYVEIKLVSANKTGRNINFIFFPIVNLDTSVAVGNEQAIVFRLDTFPTINFQDGLYDLFLGHRLGQQAKAWEYGTRLFWGGYSPNEAAENNNRIFLAGISVRKNF